MKAQLTNRLLLFCLGCILPLILGAQPEFGLDYTPLKSQGPIPESILTSTTLKSETDIKKTIDKNSAGQVRKKKTEFIIESNYLIDRLLKSHLLLFNTPLNQLVEEITALILKDDPEANQDIDLYIIKSSEVNAFATDRGDIFITMGLLARLDTEAELAFVIAHEIIHYKEKHNMDAFSEYESIDQNSRHHYSESMNNLLKKSKYSQKLETIADKEGLSLFARAGYAFEDVIHVFDILDLAHAPVFNIPIDKSMFEFNDIRIDSSDWLKKTTEVQPLEDYDYETIYDDEGEVISTVNQKEEDDEENYSTHPDIQSRKDALEKNRADYNPDDRKQYLVKTPEAFAQLATMAQFELAQILLQEREYSAALYHCYALLKKFPDNAYLQKSFTYGLYGLGEYALIDELDQVVHKHKSIQGEWKRINFLFFRLTRKEIGTLAAAHCWKTHLQYPEDEKMERMARDIIEDVVIYEIENPLDFFDTAPVDTAKLNNTAVFARFAFSEFMNDSTFVNHLKKGMYYRDRKNSREEYQKSAQYKKDIKREIKKGKSIGAKKVVMVNPTHLEGNVSVKGNARIDYIRSEAAQKELKSYIDEAAKDLDLHTEIMDINDLKNAGEIDQLNDIRTIEHWSDEYFTHPTYMVATNHNEAMALCEKLNTDYFAYSGFITFYKQKNIAGIGLSLALGSFLYIIPATSPFMVYHTFKRGNETFYYLNALNVRDYSLELHDVNWVKIKGHPEVLKSYLYWSMNQLKRSKKPSNEKKN